MAARSWLGSSSFDVADVAGLAVPRRSPPRWCALRDRAQASGARRPPVATRRAGGRMAAAAVTAAARPPARRAAHRTAAAAADIARPGPAR